MPYNVSSLSPEEKDRLLEALIEKAGLEAPEGSHADVEQDKETMKPLVDAVLALCEKVKAIDESLS